MNAVYALYSEPQSAEKVLAELRARAPELGVQPRQICVLSGGPFEEYNLGWREQKTRMPWLAVLGGVVGGAAGYLLAAVSQRWYPLPTGNMPIVALWPTSVIMYELTMLGAILATLLTLLVTTRSPHATRRIYDPEVSAGKILIGVANPADASRAQLEQLLRASGNGIVRGMSPP
jgi:Alternative complex III, ActD subunit